MAPTKGVEMRFFIYALLMAGASAHAQFKCVGPDGRAQYQDRPCAAVERQTKMKISAEPPVPVAKRGEPDLALSGPQEADPLIRLYRRWADADRLAGSTARIALAGPVQRLQEIAREAGAIDVPPCVSAARSALQDLTQKSAEGYIQFMRKNELGTMVYEWIDKPRVLADFEWQVKRAGCALPK